jgi:AcrR family transcriptional regulator
MTRGRLDVERLERIRHELRGRRWHELGIEELARAAGLSRMTLHRRGVTKESLRDGLAELLATEHEAAALPALTSSAPADERLALALRGICAVNERYLGLIDGLADELRDVFHEPGAGEVLTRPTFTDALRRILEDGERDGTLTARGDATETATLLFNATGWTYRHMRSGHRWSPERASEEIVTLLVAGVRP